MMQINFSFLIFKNFDKHFSKLIKNFLQQQTQTTKPNERLIKALTQIKNYQKEVDSPTTFDLDTIAEIKNLIASLPTH